MQKLILFYSTNSEQRDALRAIEGECPVQYFPTGLFDSPSSTIYKSCVEIPGFGISESGNVRSLQAYLVLQGELELNLREVLQRDGSVKYAIDHRANPKSITFTPSSMYMQKCLNYGTITGVSDDADSIILFDLFRKKLMGESLSIKSFKVSPGAIALRQEGGRLTPNVKSNPIMDLALES